MRTNSLRKSFAILSDWGVGAARKRLITKIVKRGQKTKVLGSSFALLVFGLRDLFVAAISEKAGLTKTNSSLKEEEL